MLVLLALLFCCNRYETKLISIETVSNNINITPLYYNNNNLYIAA